MPEVFLDVLLTDPSDWHDLAIAIGDRHAKQMQRSVDALQIAYADLAKLEGGDLNAAGEDAITMAFEVLAQGLDG